MIGYIDLIKGGRSYPPPTGVSDAASPLAWLYDWVNLIKTLIQLSAHSSTVVLIGKRRSRKVKLRKICLIPSPSLLLHALFPCHCFSSFVLHFFFQITDQYSCDRISEAADESAKSINGELDAVYMDNNQSPMKWQYFGSEYGIINQFPASKAPDCSSYDHRFRSVILIGLWKMLVFEHCFSRAV